MNHRKLENSEQKARGFILSGGRGPWSTGKLCAGRAGQPPRQRGWQATQTPLRLGRWWGSCGEGGPQDSTVACLPGGPRAVGTLPPATQLFLGIFAVTTEMPAHSEMTEAEQLSPPTSEKG